METVEYPSNHQLQNADNSTLVMVAIIIAIIIAVLLLIIVVMKIIGCYLNHWRQGNTWRRLLYIPGFQPAIITPELCEAIIEDGHKSVLDEIDKKEYGTFD